VASVRWLLMLASVVAVVAARMLVAPYWHWPTAALQTAAVRIPTRQVHLYSRECERTTGENTIERETNVSAGQASRYPESGGGVCETQR